jgi:hypothetical protein
MVNMDRRKSFYTIVYGAVDTIYRCILIVVLMNAEISYGMLLWYDGDRQHRAVQRRCAGSTESELSHLEGKAKLLKRKAILNAADI